MNTMEKNQDIRWIQRFVNFSRAFTQLMGSVELASQRQLSALEQLGMIHLFQCTHDLSGEVLIEYLKDRGAARLYGPKDAVREACTAALITEGDVWMEMIRDRNQSSHTYNLEIAEAIAERIQRTYIHAFRDVQRTFEELAHEERS